MRLHLLPSWSTRLTALALVLVAVGIWIQALSGAPEYPTIPPGPIVLVPLAAVIALVNRWRWIPLTGTLLSAVILAVAFATPYTAAHLSEPAAVGVFTGTVLQMLVLILGVLAGIAASAESYQSRTSAVICRILGTIFIAIGMVAIVRGSPENLYHNLLHIATGIVALYLGFANWSSGAKSFCLAFGAFYLGLGALGIAMGDPAVNRVWDVGPLHLTMGDHGFHLILGTMFLMSGLLTRDVAPERVDERRTPAVALRAR